MGNCNSSQTDISEYDARVQGNQEQNRGDQMATSGSPDSFKGDGGMAWLSHNYNSIKRTSDELGRALKEYEEVYSKLRQREEQLKQKEEENKVLQERLAKVSETKLMQDSSGKTENIQRRNRESVLETDYRNFFSHDGIDALNVLEKCRKRHDQSKRMAEILDRRLACMVLELAYQEAQKACIKFLSSCPYILNSASSVGTRLEREQTKRTSETRKLRFEVGCNLPNSYTTVSMPFKDMMLSELGEMSRESDIHELCESIKDSVTTELHKEKDFSRHYNIDDLKENMKKYIHNCARLCWRLVTHNPPLKVVRSHSGERQPFDPHRHQICQDLNIGGQRSRDGSSFNAVTVWPALVDHKGRVLAKAEVILEDSAV